MSWARSRSGSVPRSPRRSRRPTPKRHRGGHMRWSLIAILVLAAGSVAAQESQIGADFRGEHQRVAEDCSKGFKGIFGCAEELFTDHPLHIALGSIAPQNGFGAGGALVLHYTPNENWRLSWNVDAIGSSNASWRAGAYMKIIHAPPQHITVVTTPGGAPPKSKLAVRQYTVFNLYAQGIGLNKLYYFGEGPDTTTAGQSVYTERQAIAGGNAVVPVWRKASLALFGEINGRFVTIGNNNNAGSPSIGTLYNNATAPGLASQPGFAQFGEGIRL